MTELQAGRIQELRMRGIGYRAIGDVLGMNRDAVRNYCKAHGLLGYGAAVRINIKEQIAEGIACQCCGKLLEQPERGRKRRFCSDKCRREWWSSHQEEIRRSPDALYEGICAFCGRPFTAYGNQHRKYCSHDCYIRARFGNPDAASGREEEGETHERNAMADAADRYASTSIV